MCTSTIAHVYAHGSGSTLCPSKLIPKQHREMQITDHCCLQFLFIIDTFTNCISKNYISEY